MEVPMLWRPRFLLIPLEPDVFETLGSDGKLQYTLEPKRQIEVLLCASAHEGSKFILQNRATGEAWGMEINAISKEPDANIYHLTAHVIMQISYRRGQDDAQGVLSGV
jgi:hypothetical protein